MTVKHTTLPYYPPSEQFPERLPRNDMQNSIYLDYPGHQPALNRHYGDSARVLVISEMPVGWNLSRRRGLLYPDLLVAFGVDRAEAIARRGYAIDYHGKPPDFVLEIASLNTAENDYREKRKGYAGYGVPEYWRFDPTGGDHYPVGLAGDRLVDGEYQPISIVRVDDDRYWGHSDVLNLDLCWEYGQLRWYDPVSQQYLRTHDEEADGRNAAERQRDAEREGRIAAEAEAAESRARVRELEEELRRRSL